MIYIKQKFFIFGFLILLTWPNLSLAQVKNQDWMPLDVTSLPCKAVVILDASSGEPLFNYSEADFGIPASLTKLLTIMVFLDEKPNLNKIVTLTKQDEVGGGRLRVNYGSKFLLKDALYSTLIASTNNTAIMLARASGLDYKDFVAKMNQKAQKWGLDAYFNEAAGMSPANITTPIQMAKIAREAFQYPLIRQISQLATYEFKIRNTGLVKKVSNTDLLVGADNDFTVTASKTGYLPEGGNNLAISAKNNDGPGEIIVLTMGSPTKPDSFASVKAATEWAFKNYSWTAIEK